MMKKLFYAAEAAAVLFCLLSCENMLNEKFDTKTVEGSNGSLSWKYDVLNREITVSGSCDASAPFTSSLLTGIDAERVQKVNVQGASIYLGDRAFCDFDNIKVIKLKKGISGAGKDIFDGLDLEKLEISDDVDIHGWDPDWAHGCNRDICRWYVSGGTLYITGVGNMSDAGWKSQTFTSVVISENIKNICNDAFNGCSGLTSITIPSGITAIGANAFYGCTGISNLTIPSGVTYVGINAFYSWTSGQKITLSWASSDTTTRTLPGLNSTATSAAVTYSDGRTYTATSSQITWYVSGNTLYVNGYGTVEWLSGLYGKTYANVVVGDGFTGVSSSNAWAGVAAVKNVSLPSTLTTIYSSTFSGCTGLTSMVLPSSVQTIGTYAFSGCTGITSLQIPADVKTIDSNAFAGWTSAQTITVGWSPSDTAIRSLSGLNSTTNSTNSTSTTTITVGYSPNAANVYFSDGSKCGGCGSIDNYTYVPNYTVTTTGCWFIAIDGTNIATLYVNGTGIMSSSGWSSFSFTKAVLSGVTSIGTSAFYGNTSLMSITIPSTVTSIGSNAFNNCTGITNLTIPSSVVTIDSYAFGGWTSAQTITLGWASTDTTTRSLTGIGTSYTNAKVYYSDGVQYTAAGN